MRYGPYLLLAVELPLALPAAMAGLRIATVSAVSLVTAGAIVGYGGLGNLIYSGMNPTSRRRSTACALRRHRRRRRCASWERSGC
ncbi:hypothetical protein SMICM17S_12549 [Streptomyces microflavus]